MVGTRTTARDWQWLDEMMVEDASAERPTQKIWRMPESYGPPTQQTQGGASTIQAAWLDGLSSPRFQPMIDEILLSGDSGYRPKFDGTQLDGCQAFMALDGTPPSAAHVQGGSWEVPFMAPAAVLTPPASPALAKQPDEPAARGRAYRVPRQRDCGTGGHM
ncbi:hypothetical protein PIB30_005013 [Stylosanthes scabra]|uniref:Uncharacterized protein n=1 Tax=Stylosanthes scabra TaxID=79078 RepID=A0ABU6Y5L1_9FABA|nr:hypothetical protein [Stylosanthes scabra]